MIPRLLRDLGKASWASVLGLAGVLALAGCATGIEGLPGPVGCTVEKLTDVKVTMQRNEPHVTVDVNDWDLNMVLDTGAENTLITERAAAPLKLRRGGGSVIQGIGGSQPSWIGQARVISFGGVTLRDFPIRVAQVDLPRPNGTPPDGMLGSDILSGYDIDLDLANNRVGLYKPRACPEGGPGWDLPYVVLPIAPGPRGRITIQLELDGVQIATVLDTGAEMTTVSRVSALRAGRSAEQIESGGKVTITGATDKKITAYRHQFNTLRIGRMLAQKPVLVVADLPGAARDAILGVDFMRGRRIWISQASARVYIALPAAAAVAQNTVAPAVTDPATSPR